MPIIYYEKYIPYNFGKTTKKYINGVEQNAVMFGLLGMGKSIKKWIGEERSYNKRVPKGLMNGSHFQRLEVLKGLIQGIEVDVSKYTRFGL